MTETESSTSPISGFGCLACGCELTSLYRLTRSINHEHLEYNILKCPACGHMRAEGPCGDSLLEKIYSESFHRTSQQFAPEQGRTSFAGEKSSTSPVVQNALMRVNMLRRFGISGRLLDVGAGCGYFVKAASTAFDAEGIELSPHAVSVARGIGATVHCGNFSEVGRKLDMYDVITMWDVLAGFKDPAAAIGRAAQLLKAGGWLVLTMPDATSMAARITGRYWHLMMPPVNLHFFSAQSLKLLLAKHGLELVTFGHYAKRISVDFIIVKALRTIGLSSVNSIGIPANIALSINLRDILTAVARKAPFNA